MTGSEPPALRLRRQVRTASPGDERLSERFDRLLAIVTDLGSCVLALSGGIDSSLLLAVTSDVLGSRCVAVTGDSAALPVWDREDAASAASAAASHGVTWRAVTTRELDDPRYAINQRSRCFFCKSELYGRLGEIARAEGLDWVVDGTNATDVASSDRPGMAAAHALNVRSPLAEAGLEKVDVRALARGLGIEGWDRPASACLASRIPYGVRITPELLRRVEQAELGIRGLGFAQVRVRDFDGHARVEVERPELERLLRHGDMIDEIVRSAGFSAWSPAEYVGRGAGDGGDLAR